MPSILTYFLWVIFNPTIIGYGFFIFGFFFINVTTLVYFILLSKVRKKFFPEVVTQKKPDVSLGVLTQKKPDISIYIKICYLFIGITIICALFLR